MQQTRITKIQLNSTLFHQKAMLFYAKLINAVILFFKCNAINIRILNIVEKKFCCFVLIFIFTFFNP